MKHFSKFASILLALAMILSLSATAFAAETTGSITINSADNVSVAGKTFNAYKILDLELVGDGYVYTVPAELETFYATKFSLDPESGDFDYEVTQKIAEMTDNSDDLFAFAAEALAAAKAAGVTPATQTGAEGAASVVLEDLPLGYYVIEDAGAATPISALMLDSTNPDVDITIKADKPELEKKIDGDKDTDDTTEGKVDFNNAAIGDQIPYVLTSAVPDMTGYTKYFFIVTDTLSAGLTFNNDVAITLGGDPLTADKDYTVTVASNEDGTTTVEIVFVNFIQYKAQEGAAIEITYSATLDEDAVIGVEGNPNEVTLEYSNNPTVTPNGDPENPNKPGSNDPTGETPKDETYTYVTDLEIIKVDSAGNRLEGAVFTLTGTKLNKVIVENEAFVVDNENGTYWLLKDGTYTTDDPTAEGMDQDAYADTTTKYTKTGTTEVVTVTEDVTLTAAVGADGKLTFTGLSAGTYTITEIKAPDGYNLLDAPIEVTITWTAPAEGSTECTWTYANTDTEGEGEEKVFTNHVTVVNQTGTELPETGGMGTVLFYAIGGILVLVAVVLLVTKRRMGNAE